MKDKAFIDSTVKTGQEAREKADSEFSGISLEQLNWKPFPTSWSIAECLEHLLIADSSYFEDLKKIIAGTYKMSFWEKCSPLTSLWSKTLKDQLQEKVKKKDDCSQKIHPDNLQ